MPRYRDEAPAVRVYTVCDESSGAVDLASGVSQWMKKIVSPSLMFTGSSFICLAMPGRFAKRKLDEFAFLGNKLQVSYAPQFESFSDTNEKLEGRRTKVLGRLNPRRIKGSTYHHPCAYNDASLVASPAQTVIPQKRNPDQRDYRNLQHASHTNALPITRVSSDQDYFPSQSMNQTVHLVREKLNEIQSSTLHLQAGYVSKKPRVDNRRRI